MLPEQEPAVVASMIALVKPYLVGALGAVASFLHDVINNERTLNYLVMIFWAVLGAMFAGWLDDELVSIEKKYDLIVHGKGLLLFFSGGAFVVAYPKVRETFASLLVSLAERFKAFVEKLKP